MKRHRCLSIILIAISSITAAYSQENPAQLKEAAALHNKYSFSKAIEIYRGILEHTHKKVFDQLNEAEGNAAYTQLELELPPLAPAGIPQQPE